MKEKLVATVVLYLTNKQGVEKVIENINSYAPFVEKIYIVDNRAFDNSEIAKKVSNSVYIPNLKNLGIATALNKGCELALQDGFEWILTMDQDSNFKSDELSNFLYLCEKHYIENQNIKSFAPEQNDSGKNVIAISKWICFNILSPMKRKVFGTPKTLKKDVESVNYVITSANIIYLPIWENIGKFDEKLFIDEVDHDFCIRLKLHGYEIVKFNTCFVEHTLGNRKITLFPKYNYQSDFRLFYIFRNLMIENARYGNLPFARNFKKEIWYYFKDYCIFDIKAIKHIFIFFRAQKAFKEFIKTDSVIQNTKGKQC